MTRDLVLNHLQNALKPTNPETKAQIEDLVESPIENPNHKGGLTQKGLETFKNDPEVCRAGALHKDQARVAIRATLATCAIFAKSKKMPLSETEQRFLKEGIPIRLPSGQQDTIKTTKKGGKILTGEMEGMMEDLYGALAQTDPRTQTILAAAQAQNQTKEREKQSIDIPEMA
jgi:hypothetical protein